MAAGASAGAAFGPYGAAIGAVAGGLMDNGGGGAANMAPLVSSSSGFLDGSGWVVNMGSGTATGGKSGSAADTSQASGGLNMTMVIMAVVAIVLIKSLKH